MSPRPFLVALIVAQTVAGCSLLESGPVAPSREDRYIETEYGAAPGTPVTVRFADQSLAYNVRLSGKHPRVLVQATEATAEATRGAIAKLSLGLVDRPLEDAPYREAALTYLAGTGKTACALQMGGQVAQNGFEWTYACAR